MEAPIDQTPAGLDLTARLASLSEAWDWTADRLDVVDVEDLRRTTPCADFDLAELLDHLAQSVERFVTALGGTVPATAGASPARRFSLLRDAHLAAWGRADPAGAYELPLGVVPAWLALDLNLAEIVLHGWDVSRATGERADVPAGLATVVLGIGTQLLSDETRSGAFAPAVTLAADSAASDLMAAWYGRQP